MNAWSTSVDFWGLCVNGWLTPDPFCNSVWHWCYRNRRDSVGVDWPVFYFFYFIATFVNIKSLWLFLHSVVIFSVAAYWQGFGKSSMYSWIMVLYFMARNSLFFNHVKFIAFLWSILPSNLSHTSLLCLKKKKQHKTKLKKRWESPWWCSVPWGMF